MDKPRVAFANEEAARLNIRRKIDRLRSMFSAGVLTEDAPKSLNQFNAWSFAGVNPDDCFSKNGHETLTRHESLKADARELTALAKKWEKPTPPARALSVSRARDKVQLHMKLRQIAERHALQMLSENIDLRKELATLRANFESMADELTRIRREYEAELQKVRNRNSELIKSAPRNVKALRNDV